MILTPDGFVDTTEAVHVTPGVDVVMCGDARLYEISRASLVGRGTIVLEGHLLGQPHTRRGPMRMRAQHRTHDVLVVVRPVEVGS